MGYKENAREVKKFGAAPVQPPSYPPQALLGPDRAVAANHPGSVDYKAQNPTAFQDIDLTAAGLGVIPAAAQGAIVFFNRACLALHHRRPGHCSCAREELFVLGGTCTAI